MESEAIDERDLEMTVNGGKSKRGSEGNLPPRKRRKPSGIQLEQSTLKRSLGVVYS